MNWSLSWEKRVSIRFLNFLQTHVGGFRVKGGITAAKGKITTVKGGEKGEKASLHRKKLDYKSLQERIKRETSILPTFLSNARRLG